MAATPHTSAPLKCGATTPDKNSWVEKKTYNIGSLSSDLNTYINVNVADAVRQRDLFTNQPCPKPDECKKTEVVAPAPTCTFSIVAGKALGSFDVTFTTAWSASVKCEPKTNFDKQKPSAVMTPGANPVAVGYWKYECINNVIWITICSPNGAVVSASVKTDQGCPITDLPVPPYTVTALCFEGFWWLVIKDPKGKQISMHITDTACVKKEEPKKEDKKDDAKKDH